jgi:hypothetical protein
LIVYCWRNIPISIIYSEKGEGKAHTCEIPMFPLTHGPSRRIMPVSSEEALMKRSSPPRGIAKLSESVHQQLNMYALAAGAAGVGMLVLAQSAEARIVYTAADVHFHTDTQHKKFVYKLDLNHDGIVDFTITDEIGTNMGGSSFLWMGAQGATGSNAVQEASYPGWAAALSVGAPIGNARIFKGTGAMFGQPCPSCRGYGYWGGRGNRYLGVRFTIRGKTHYGWARLSVQPEFKTITAVLSGYAYETIPGKAIRAGQRKETADEPTNEDLGTGASLPRSTPDTLQPATLGALAMGAPGLSIWRRDESVWSLP